MSVWLLPWRISNIECRISKGSTFDVLRSTSALLITLSACSRAGTDNATAVRDSAGVTIVEGPSPAWNEDDEWQVSDEPLLDIGEAEGSPEYQFSSIEGGVRLDDGTLVIADGGSQELRFYDAAGMFVRSSGRSGEAPGEYRQIAALGSGPGDSLWVYDFGLRRFTVLTATGEAVRTLSVGGTLSAVNAVGRLPDGSFVVKESWSSGSGDEIRLGLVRDPVAIVRFSPDGRRQDTIATVPGREIFLTSEGGRGVMSAPLFAHTSAAAIRNTELVVGDQTELQVAIYQATGTLKQIFRVPDRDLHLTRDEVTRTIDGIVAGEPPERRPTTRAHYDAMDTPSMRPAYGDLVVDRSGDVWLAEYVRPPTTPRRWTVLGIDGKWLGEVRVPDRVAVLEIGKDWLLGVWRDALDVEHVRLYRLSKPE